ncbi:MAG: DUF4919 domain-containing protein [Alistipes sp.]|nr:DUF4919 domain-containing protein [Alistipes sp.]
MKTTLIATLLLAFCLTAHAQQPEQGGQLSDDELLALDPVLKEAVTADGVNLSVFGKYARDDDHYRRLAERFEQNDDTLLSSDIYTLYYGYVWRDEYNGGYTINDWSALIAEQRYSEAYDMVREALKEAPATPCYLETAFRLAVQLKRPEKEIRNIAWRLFKILHLIYSTGSGTGEEPWIVVNVADEYSLMRILLDVEQIKGQTVTTNEQGGKCDVIEVDPIDNAYFTGSEIWFDISFPFVMFNSPGHWAKQMSNIE